MPTSRTSTKTARLLRLAKRGPMRARDLEDARIPRAYLTRLVNQGKLEHAGRGLYRLPDADVTELRSLAEVATRVPRAIICLLSALQVHALTTEVPHAVWVMIDSRARAPKLDTPAIEVVRAHGPARDHGVEKRRIEGVSVPITTPAKTVADCFRYRRHVGLDVALAALREYVARTRARNGGAKRVHTLDALVAAADADQVYSVLRPYLEALV
jgi:predicted transcriptional regulator of viral defense system